MAWITVHRAFECRNVVLKTDESLIAIHGAFHDHFTLRWNDADPNRNQYCYVLKFSVPQARRLKEKPSGRV